jgi:hypothetical protein
MKRNRSRKSAARLLHVVTAILAVAYFWPGRRQSPSRDSKPRKRREPSGFTLLPRGPASTELQDAIQSVIENQRVLERLPRYATTVVWIEEPIEEGASLREAHKYWSDPTAASYTPPGNFRQQPADARCPAGLVRVAVECVIRRTGGMTSYYGFDGYLASLLIDPKAGFIWDARGENAS